MADSVFAKKASLMGAFFVGASWAMSVTAAPLCLTQAPLKEVKVARVIDGDTVRLMDGQRIRLANINAPELRGRGQTAEPFALAAKQALQAWVAQGNATLYLSTEAHTDRYGRTLAALYSAQGVSLEAQLLAEGLAYFVAFLPATQTLNCLQAQELLARKARKGLWRNPVAEHPQTLKHSGFAVLKGRVDQVRSTGSSAWLKVGEQLEVYLAPDVRSAMMADLAHYQGRQVEVRGWVVDTTKHRSGAESARWLLRLSHPTMLK